MSEERAKIALEWLQKQGDLSVEEQRALKDWLASDSENKRVYDHLLMEQKIQAAAVTFSKPKKSAHFSHFWARIKTKKIPYLSSSWGMACFALIMCVFLYSGYGHFIAQQNVDNDLDNIDKVSFESMNYFSTDVGERLNFSISDGSVLHLNANTQITLVENEVSRKVLLNSGEAFFEVAKNRKIPFVVETLYGNIKVLGTVFNVEHKASSVLVKVQEGHVRVVADKEIDLYSGEQVLIGLNGVGNVVSTQRDNAPGGWRTGWVSLEAQPLSDFLFSLQRYVDKPIVLNATLDTPPLISGRYNLDDPLNTLELVASLNQYEIQNLNEGYFLYPLQR